MDGELNEQEKLWNWKDILIIGIGIVVLFIVGVFILRLIGSLTGLNLMEDGNPTIFLSAGLGAVEGFALILSVYMLGLQRRNYSWPRIGVRETNARWWIWGGVLGLVAIPISGLVANFVQQLLGREGPSSQIPFLAPDGFSWVGLISMLIMGGIVAPFAEELIFRGVLYRWMRDLWGVWVGIILSSIIFGAVHGDPVVISSAFVVGILMAWIYERSNSLWSNYALHATFNCVQIIILYVSLATGALQVAS